MTATTAATVVGRDPELAAVDEFLDATSRGTAALLIEGEPGIGKTTLWHAVVQLAEERNMGVLSSRPGASEARLTFVGLADFLESIGKDVLDELPAPQRRALDVAILRADPKGSAPDRRSVSMGFLSALRALSRTTPVIVAVDDVQWLDTPSRHVLEFALRRLENEPVGFLAAVRLDGESSSSAALSDARRLRLGPLNLAALHQIIKTELGQTFPRPTLVRIERTSAGNPFYAVELARALLEGNEHVHGSQALPVPDNLRELIARRLHRLPAESRHALLVASALSHPTLDLLDETAIAAAEDAGVVRVGVDRRLVFSHPLLASAVYTSAGAGRRRRVHRELADQVRDPEERARHLALAADRPDEDVARALVEAARSAQARGATDAAVELVGLACELTPKDERDAQHARMLELALYLAGSGDSQRSVGVLRDLVAEKPRGQLRAKALLMLGLVSEWLEGGDVGVSLCEQALDEAGEDIDLRIEIHAAASRLSDHDTRRKRFHARAALDLVERAAPEPQLHALALLAFAEAEFYAGQGIRKDILEQAALLEASAREVITHAPRLSSMLHSHVGVRASERLLGILLLHADDLDGARALFEKERVASESIDEAQLTRSLGRLANVELRAGNWGLAETHIDDLERAVERTREELVGGWSLTIKAQLETLLGRVDAARKAGEEALALSIATTDAWETARSYAALGLLELSIGNLAEASAHLDRVDEINHAMGLEDPGLLRHHADHIESLIGLGELERAEAALELLEQQGRATGRTWATATAGRCRGMLLSARGDLGAAMAALDAACVEHTRLPIPFELGRTLLVKGQIHRRRNERLLAKEALLESIAIFEQLGSPIWAKTAYAELQRIGLRKGDPGELTPREEHVASLAASGLTNRVIAERIFVSPKTVEANLARVYRKLGIRSRAELGARMTERERLSKT